MAEKRSTLRIIQPAQLAFNMWNGCAISGGDSLITSNGVEVMLRRLRQAIDVTARTGATKYG